MSVDGTLAAIDGALEVWERGPDAAAWCADGGPDELDPAAGVSWLPSTFLSIQIDVSPFMAALAQVSEAVTAFAKPFLRFTHQLDAQWHPRDHVRCRQCNPAGNPKPLAVNGAAYRRRQQARRRHRR